MTALYGVIGYPVDHSLSPQIQQPWFDHFKIAAQYRKIAVKPEDLKKFMQEFSRTYAGANVTIPHKETIIPFLDRMDDVSRGIGAVNTIKVEDNQLVGYNTDWCGALRALAYGMGINIDPTSHDFSFLSGKNVLVLGAGGAARAMAYAVDQSHAKLIVLNRTANKAALLAKQYGGDAGTLADYIKIKPDVVVNATAVGLTTVGLTTPGNDSPLPCAAWKHFMQGRLRPIAVMDMVFNPLKTKMLADASKAGCTIITGDLMLKFQASESFKIWTGCLPSLAQTLEKSHG